MTPLARRLVEVWMRTPEGSAWRAVVEPSVGSGGGVRAAWDGVVDLGMISRPLNERERGLGLRVFPVARGGVVLAVQRDAPLRGLSGEEIERLYRGEGGVAGGAVAVSLLLRDREESANAALERWFPALGPLREQAYQQRRARVLYHDEAMREALVATPGAVGVVDLGAVLGEHSSLRGLAIDGVEPTLDAVREGRWKATRELSFVLRPERAERVRAFLRFVRSREARAIIEASGCVVVEGEP
jgi:phosphate transport system substrate-binding protein